MKKKVYYLDWIRVIAVFGVLYGHLVNVASFVTSMPTVIAAGNENNLPWIPAESHFLCRLDIYLANIFHTSTASVGVVLFFWLAGFLTAMSREKYSGKEFILRRLIRIFPGLILSVVLVGIVAYFSQGIAYPFRYYVLNGTLLYMFFSAPAIIGVLWTLAVEFVFDIIAIHIPVFKFRFILVADLIMGGVCIYCSIYKIKTNELIYFIKYIPIIFVGAAIYNVTKSEKKWKAVGELVLCFLMSLPGLYALIPKEFNSEVWYINMGTYFLAALIWAIFALLEYKGVGFLKKSNTFISWLTEISYLVYLLQLNIGLLAMYYVKMYLTKNAYVIVTAGVASTFLAASLVHYLGEHKIQGLLDKCYQKWKGTVNEQ